MDLKTITMVKLEDYKGSIDWRADLYDESVYLFISEGKVIAEAILFDWFEGKFDYITIDNMEVRYKGEGIGTSVVKIISDYARKEGKVGIYGESVSEALDFWNSLNVSFESNEDDPCMSCEHCEFDECDDYDFDELSPFYITCDEVDMAFDRWVRDIVNK